MNSLAPIDVMNRIHDALPDNGERAAYMESVLMALGGTWGIGHTHIWPMGEPLIGGSEYDCTEPCPFKSGTHVRRHYWLSDPITE